MGILDSPLAVDQKNCQSSGWWSSVEIKTLIKPDRLENLRAADDLAEPIENIGKPANFIPSDGLLARCVRMLVAEGYSQTRVARELDRQFPIIPFFESYAPGGMPNLGSSS